MVVGWGWWSDGGGGGPGSLRQSIDQNLSFYPVSKTLLWLTGRKTMERRKAEERKGYEGKPETKRTDKRDSQEGQIGRRA